MNMRVWQMLKVGALALFAGMALVGCGGTEAPATNIPAASTPTSGVLPTGVPATAPGGTPGAATWPAAANAGVANAKQALAGQLGAAAPAIRVVSVTPHDWPNAALGCEQPGQAYAQVITPGYILVLDAGGTQYTYNADAAGNVVTCPTPAR
jgi:hypothetical protein